MFLTLLLMLQVRSNVSIKDNSGLIRGKIISNNVSSKGKVGSTLKMSVTRAKLKANFKSAHTRLKQSMSAKGQLQDLIIIQTRKPLMRNDGSTLVFDTNSGVCINSKGGLKKRLILGFKRINTSVPFELKKQHCNFNQTFSFNLIKLAKNLM